MTALTGKTVGSPDFTYLGLLHFEDNSEITGSLKKIQDGDGNDTGIELSTAKLKYTGTFVLQSLTASKLIYLNASKEIVNVTGGSDGDVLTLASGLPAWVTPSSGITIDTTPITGGASGRILFESASGKVTESSTFKIDSGKLAFGAASALALAHFEDTSTNQVGFLIKGYGGNYSGSLLPFIFDAQGKSGVGRMTIDSYGYVGFGSGAGNNYHTYNYKVDFGDGRVLMGNTLRIQASNNDRRFEILYGGYYTYMSNDRGVSGSLKLFADSGMGVTLFTNGASYASLISHGALLRQQYSNSVFEDKTIGSTGEVTYDITGASPKFIFNKKVNMSALPTSSAGLSSGDLWNDSGTVKIV